MNTAAFWVSYLLLWLLVGILSLSFLELLRQIGQLRLRLRVDSGPTLVRRADSSAHRKLPARIAWNDHLKTEPGVLVFLSPSCATCKVVGRELGGLMKRLASDTSIVAIVEGRTKDEARSFANEMRLPEAATILDEGATITRELEVQERPAAALVQDSEIGDVATVRDVAELEAFIRLAQARREGIDRLQGAEFVLAGQAERGEAN